MRRVLLCLFLFFAVTVPCSAQGDKAKPNTLTPKEIADGWILLFDGATTFGWNVVRATEKAGLNVTDGSLDLRQMGSGTIASRTEFESFDLTFEYKLDKGSANVGFKVTETNSSDQSLYILNKHQKWTRVTVKINEGRIKFNSQFDPDPWKGVTPIRFIQLEGGSLQLRNIKLRPLDTAPLINGKDLTGWKTFPGAKYKSKFAVIDNAINVKNGPGDLQTLSKYKDFILQLECKSNGKHLNSGIFFRCRDNEYQNGYEAQIRNQFTQEPTQKYLIEEYDPKTHKLLGKKEIKSTAVDFGTGAIYRRVPARKEMSKDGEWFSMTIAAQGNHFATWVNGVQVTDWTDNRPLSDNARTGCRLEGGHLSIQGHDPTTDLSFRNIRIVEMK